MKPGSIPTSTTSSTSSSRRNRRRGLKICGGLTAILLIIAAAVFTALVFTVFKPKEPEITAHPAGLEDIQFSFSNVTINVTLDMIITINNKKNYGSFMFKNTTAYVNYHGDVVAEVPIQQSLVPARGKINVTSSADFMVSKVMLNPSFVSDVVSGSLNLTSTAAMHGKVSLFKVIKMHATAFSFCDISFFITARDIQTKCKSKIKL